MHIDMQPQDDMNGLPGGERDREGAMAKADLYKLANYSLKLFKMMEANTQLEGWVQAKITKAADYVASVYHYMEYEMKFSEYGQAIDDSDVYSESQKRALRGKLMEAKEKIKDLKKAQAEKIKKKEEKVDEASGVRATDKKKGKVEKSEKKQYFVKLEKDGATKGMTITADEGEAQSEVRDRAARDARSGGWTVASIRLKDSGSGEELDEAKKSKKAKRDFDKDGEVETEKEEVFGSRRKAAGLPFKESAEEKFAKERQAKRDAEEDEWAKSHALDKVNLRRRNKQDAEDEEFLASRSGSKTKESIGQIGNKLSAAAKSAIPATATTTVPGMRATGADLKKANASAALGEGKCNHTPKGKACPVHGLKECGTYMEAKKGTGDVGKPNTGGNKGFKGVVTSAKKSGYSTEVANKIAGKVKKDIMAKK
jgi:hypothetical protein